MVEAWRLRYESPDVATWISMVTSERVGSLVCAVMVGKVSGRSEKEKETSLSDQQLAPTVSRQSALIQLTTSSMVRVICT